MREKAAKRVHGTQAARLGRLMILLQVRLLQASEPCPPCGLRYPDSEVATAVFGLNDPFHEPPALDEVQMSLALGA